MSSDASPSPRKPQRFGRLIERDDGADFPFYNEMPTRVDGRRWAILLGSIVVAFLVLSRWPLDEWWGIVLAQIVFVAIPLATLRWMIPTHWTALWRRVHPRDAAVIVGYWLLALVVQLGVGSALGVIDKTAASDPAAAVREAGVAIPAHFIGALPQLMGEELLAIVPFLAVMWLCVTKLGTTRRLAVVIALIVSSLWFGAVHLPTYDWNVLQAVVGVGLVRVVLTLAYVRTKNLWVSFGAHVLTDWFIFATLLR
jgi:membrane protease YdiL (CAAX protease family)